MIKGVLALVVLVLLLVGSSSALDISSCRSLNDPFTVYRLTADVTAAGTCFSVAAPDVTLDCGGHKITYSQSAVGYAVDDAGGYDRVTVRNCVIEQGGTSTYSHGINLGSVTGGIVEDNTINTHGYASFGINLSRSIDSRVVFNNVHTWGAAGYCIEVWRSNQSNISDNVVYSSNTGVNGHGIAMWSTSYNNVANNNIRTAGNTAHGIILNPGNRATLSGNTILATGPSSFDIQIVAKSENNKIVGNTMTSTQSYSLHISAIPVTPSGNMIYNNLINSTAQVLFSGTIGANTWNTAKTTAKRIYGSGNQIGGNYYTNPAKAGYSDTCADADHDGFCDTAYTFRASNIDLLPLSDEYVATTTTTTTTTTVATTTSSTTTSSSSSTTSTTLFGNSTTSSSTTSTTLFGNSTTSSTTTSTTLSNVSSTTSSSTTSTTLFVNSTTSSSTSSTTSSVAATSSTSSTVTTPRGGEGGGTGGGSDGGGSGGGGSIIQKPRISCFDGIRNQNETGVDCGGPCAPCMSCSDGIQNQRETGIDCGGPCRKCPKIRADGRYYVGENMTVVVEYAWKGLMISVKEPGKQLKSYEITSVDKDQKYTLKYVPSEEGMVLFKAGSFDERYVQIKSRQIIPILEEVPPEARSLFIPLLLAGAVIWLVRRRTKVVVDEQILDGFEQYTTDYLKLIGKYGRFYTAADKEDKYTNLSVVVFVELNAADLAQAEAITTKYGLVPSIGRALLLCKMLHAKTYLTTSDLPEEIHENFNGTKIIRP